MQNAIENEIAELRRQLANIKRCLFFLSAALVVAPLMVAARPMVLDELRVKKLVVEEASGVPRVVIANSELFPPPLIAGKTYPRKVQPAGLVFYDSKGCEMGGLALTDNGTQRVGALAFDYPNFDAVGLRTVARGNSFTSGLVINSRPPSQLDAIEASKVVQQRIAIHNRDENAEIIMTDREGRERLRLLVDSAGDPKIELLDSSGKVVQRIPAH